MNDKIEIKMQELQSIGENIKAGIQDGLLVLVIDPAQQIGLSSTGKMMGIASTGGFQNFPGGFKGNVYIGKKA